MATQFFRNKVSKQKRRFVDKTEGFDLDLSYITKNIIAMGFPSEDSERFYRNPYSEVIRFLNIYHKDKYKVYNLCSERGYDPAKFDNRVACYPFDDHNAPQFELIDELCKDVKALLDSDEDNVAVIHCKAGKGRTGLMICCWLLYDGSWPDAESAQQFYAVARTKNQKGVTIPSQIRYINYFQERMKSPEWNPDYKEIKITTITFNGIPKIQGDIKMTLFMDRVPHRPWKPTEQEKENFRKRKGQIEGLSKKQSKFVINCNSFPVIRDVKVQFDEKKLRSTEVLFTFWFNTWFIRDSHLHLEQPQIDRANKDKQNKIFPSGFSIDVQFDHIPDAIPKEKEEEEEDQSGPLVSSPNLVDDPEDSDAYNPKSADALNDRGGSWANKPSHYPCDVVVNLLDLAIDLYKSGLQSDEYYISAKNAPKRHDGETEKLFQAFEVATGELQRAHLDDLDENELLLFWVNTLNLMYLHAFLVFGPSSSPAAREKMLEKACYNIGGLIYPLVVVEHVMIGYNLKGCSEMGALHLPKAKVKEKDPRHTHILKNPPNYVHFAIAGGARCLPYLVVYRDPQTILSDLHETAQACLVHVLSIPGKISLGAYVSWHRKDFGKREVDMVQNLLELAGHEMTGYSSVVYAEPDWEFGYFFLHLIKNIPLRQALESYTAPELDEKAKKRKELNTIMDEIDGMEEARSHFKKTRSLIKFTNVKKKGGRPPSVRGSLVSEPRSESYGEIPGAETRNSPPSSSLGMSSSNVQSQPCLRNSNDSATPPPPPPPPKLKSPRKSPRTPNLSATCEMCSEKAKVFCQTCDAHMCQNHLSSEHSSIVFRKHVMIDLKTGGPVINSNTAPASPNQSPPKSPRHARIMQNSPRGPLPTASRSPPPHVLRAPLDTPPPPPNDTAPPPPQDRAPIPPQDRIPPPPQDRIPPPPRDRIPPPPQDKVPPPPQDVIPPPPQDRIPPPPQDRIPPPPARPSPPSRPNLRPKPVGQKRAPGSYVNPPPLSPSSKNKPPLPEPVRAETNSNGPPHSQSESPDALQQQQRPHETGRISPIPPAKGTHRRVSSHSGQSDALSIQYDPNAVPKRPVVLGRGKGMKDSCGSLDLIVAPNPSPKATSNLKETNGQMPPSESCEKRGSCYFVQTTEGTFKVPSAVIEVDDDTLNLFERAEKFGVRLSSKPVEEFEQEEEVDLRDRASTMEQLKPENVGRKWGVNLKKSSEDVACE